MRNWIALAVALSFSSAGTAAAQDGESSAADDAADAAAAAEEAAADVADEAEAAAGDAQEAADEAEAAADDAQEAAEEAATTAEDERPARVRRGRAPADRSTGSQPTATPSDDAATRTADAAGDEDAELAQARDSWRVITQAELRAPQRSYPYVDLHGYFRFRVDNFWNLDLGTDGTSPIAPPLEALVNDEDSRFFAWNNRETLDESQEEIGLGQYQKDNANFLSTANISLRLNPTIHVSERASIHMELDILDNMALGSSPYWDDNSLAFFSQTQASPTASSFARDAVTVNQAYGQISAFFGSLRVGRMGNDWGLGMMFNDGGSWSPIREARTSNRGVALEGHTCLDCDRGDYVDRAEVKFRVFDHYLMAAYDYNFGGPTTPADSEVFGQQRDLSQFDDVRSFVFAAYSRPESTDEIALRNRQLNDERVPVIDYGAYFMYRKQRITTEYCDDSLFDPTGAQGASNECIEPRGGNAFIPDLWFRLQYQPSFGRRLRLEVEGAAVLGKIDFADNDFRSDDFGRDLKLRQFGGALEFEYQNLLWTTGFNAGFATGRSMSSDSNPGWGVRDGVSMNQDNSLSAFMFDQNYFVDAVMFREVIGTVTNALYLNPFFQYELIAKENDTLGIRIDAIGAMAARPSATPSGNGFYGVESNLTVFYQQPRFGVDLMTGVFIPGNAFNAEEGRPRLPSYRSFTGDNVTFQTDEDQRARAAFTMQTRFFWAF